MEDAPVGTVDTARASAARGVLARTDLIVAAILAAVVFSWNYTIERSFDGQKALQAYDILFNADTLTRLVTISNGRAHPTENLVHPGMSVYFSRPIRLAGKFARATGLIRDRSREQYALHRSLGLLVI